MARTPTSSPSDPAIPEPLPPHTNDGLVFAIELPGSPQSPVLHWDDLRSLGSPEHPLWIHLDRTTDRAKKWIRQESGLPKAVAETLLAEETRPRAEAIGDGLMVILRGVNVNPGAEPDDLIALRMWIEPDRIITLRQHRFRTIRDLRERGERGDAPASAAELLVAISQGLAMRLGPVVENLLEQLDDTENALAEEQSSGLDARPIASVRRQAIRIRRYLAPQRDALMSLASSPISMLDPHTRAELMETAQSTARFVEDLEEVRDRAAVTQEELRAIRELRSQRTVYVLTLIAAVFLPLGLLTGLLGINVGGMPGANSPWAFWIVTGLLVVIAIVLVIAFKKLRWL